MPTRAERLLQLTEALRPGAATTVPALARRFGVSERTMARDLALLRDQGIPIESTSGPAGGVRLLRSDAGGRASIAFTDTELAALWLSVWLTASRLAPDAASPAVSAFEKLEAGLPVDQRRRLRALAAHVLVGHAAGEHLARATATPTPEVVAALALALERRCVVDLTYEDAAGTLSERRIEPHALLVQVPLWYVLALDRTRGAPRTFRLDRVRSAVAQPQTSFRDAAVRELFPEIAAAGAAIR